MSHDTPQQRLSLPLRAVRIGSSDGFDFGWCAVDADNRVIGYCLTEGQAAQLVAPFAESEITPTAECVYPEECKKLGRCIKPEDHDHPAPCAAVAAPSAGTPRTDALRNEFWHEWRRNEEITFEQEAKIAHRHVRKAEELAEELERKLAETKAAQPATQPIVDVAVIERARRWAQIKFNPHDCPPGSLMVTGDCISFAQAIVAAAGGSAK